MKTTTHNLIAIVSIIALALSAGTASAANNKKKNHQQNNQQNNSSSFQQGGVGGILNLISQFKDKDDDKKPQNDKPKPPGTTKPTGPGVSQPTSDVPVRPGYVWVGDHWEREKAPQTVTTTGRPGYVWVGDHWEREKAPSGMTMITDPIPGQTLVTAGGVVVRDHRKGLSQGGVTVTNTPVLDPRKQTSKWGYPTVVPSANIRDHRTPPVASGNGSGGVTVTSSGTTRPKPSGGLLNTVTNGLSNVGQAAGAAAGAVGNAVGQAGNAVGIGYGSVTPAGGSQPAGPMRITVVRDHRTQ